MKPILLAYRSDWDAEKLPPNRIDFRNLTHLAHAFALIRQDGTVTFPDEAQARALVTAAHRHGVRVLLSIGGAESNVALSRICADPKNAVRLADTLVAFIHKIGYDGADIDWELPESTADGQRLTLLTRLIRERLPRPTLVALAVNPVDWYGRWYDSASLIPLVDWIAVMCYDFYGSWSGRSGYHAGLYPAKDAVTRSADAALLCGDAAMRYWRDKKRWPTDKLLFGIPLYLEGFKTRKWGDPISKDASASQELAYGDLPTLKGAQMERDETAVATSVSSADGEWQYSGDDAVTARRKGAWARQQRFAGVFFWELAQDGDGKTLPSLVMAARHGFETGK